MMIDEPVFRAIGADELPSRLEPGMYVVGPCGRFDRNSTLEQMRWLASSECLISCFTGMLLPFYLHNMNNLLVGVTGNIELADMFMPEMDRVGEKLSAAGAASGSLVDFIRDLAGTLSPGCPEMMDDTCMRKALLLLGAACGRSVSTVGTSDMRVTRPMKCGDPHYALAAVLGMATWCVLSLGGSGEISGSTAGGRIEFRWTKPAGSGLPHMPGADRTEEVIAMAGGAALRSGSALVIQSWTENEGKVFLAVEQ